jgi:thiol:disulfide interchange protein DsbD
VGHGKDLKTKHAFALSLSYVLGMAAAFAAAGLVVGLVGSSIQAALQAPWVLLLFSVIFVLLSLSLFGFYDLKLPESWQRKVSELSHKQKAGSYISVAVMGALSTLIVSPCVSAPLVGVLAYIGNTGNAVFGGLALFFMALGMGVPLLVVGTTFGKLLPKTGRWMNAVKNFFGVLMLGLAIWMLERIIPGPLSLMLWALLAITSSIYVGALSPIRESGWSKLWKGLGLALLTYGILMLIGAAMGNSSLLQPINLAGISAMTTNTETSTAHNFIPVKSVADVKAQLKKSKGKLVMLDFYADWCVACKKMEMNTFNAPSVKKAMDNFVLLQADVTANDAADKALQKKYGVIAPPSILFFNKGGNEIKAARIVGEMNAEPFLSHLNKIEALD